MFYYNNNRYQRTAGSYYPSAQAKSKGMNHVMPAPSDMMLAQAYVPTQQFKELFGTEEAVMHGTVFKQLFQPYKNK